jgi:hypothetical protein
MAEERPNHLHEEIKALEQILREKRKELETKGEQREDRELLKEAVQERVAEAQEKIDAPGASIPPTVPLGQIPDQSLTPPAAPSDDDPLAGLDHREQIEELATIAFSKGIVEAVNTARRAGSPHLLDEFHDALVDRLYEYLVQEGVIERSM